jgi:hypothetical protein
MHQTKEYRSVLILAAAMASAGLMAGCVSNKSAETPPPVHQWDANEDAAYQRYLMDEHLPRREFASLNAQEQQEYWDWRARNRGN